MLVNSGLTEDQAVKIYEATQWTYILMSLPVSSRYCSEARPKRGKVRERVCCKSSSIKDVSPDKGVKSLIFVYEYLNQKVCSLARGRYR
ncbi:MAG: hypothetical protein Ct9H90mP25_3440 [Gammaproteobacteria bacterium]|nr:MAG: hypothetical protein Ct9H90mP25_3440 [Gammaproteobacteria bacterium]